MTVAKVTEFIATSAKSFDDAIAVGVNRVSKTVKNVSSVWIADQEVMIAKGKITGYKVRLKATFVLE